MEPGYGSTLGFWALDEASFGDLEAAEAGPSLVR